MANKRDKILLNRAVQIIKETGSISGWDLSNELDNMPMSTFNNIVRPLLRQNPCIAVGKNKNFVYKWEMLPEKKAENNPQTSIEMWIKSSN